MRVAQLAERCGFDFISISDHVVIPRSNVSKYPYSKSGEWNTMDPSGSCLEQLATLCFLAGCTEKLRLLTSVMVVPYRPALLTAKMLATADVLSDGRVIAGVGAGWLQEEFDALQTPPYAQRGEVTDETLEAFRELWGSESPEYRGRHVRFEDILFAPRPVSGAALPVWVGGESLPAMRRTAKHGDVWYPGSGNPRHRFDTPERLSAGIERLREMFVTQGRPIDQLEVAYILFTPVQWSVQSGYDTPRRLMTGSAGQMLEDIQALERAGVEHLNLTFPSASVNEMCDGIERFAEAVLTERC